MARKKEERLEDWITGSQAAQIISENSGREVSADYVRKLVQYGKLTPRKLSERVVLYSRAEVEQITVAKRGGKHQQDHSQRKPRGAAGAGEKTGQGTAA